VTFWRRGGRRQDIIIDLIITVYFISVGGGGGRTSSLSPSEEIRSITSTNLACQEEEALKI
jgi:hypothetical protein